MENQEKLPMPQETPQEKNEENTDILKKTIEFYENKLKEQEEKFQNDIQTLLNNSKQLNFEETTKKKEIIDENDEIQESSENIIKKLNLKRR